MMKVSEIRWNDRKSADGRIAKTAKITLMGIGWQAGGRVQAIVDVAVAESAPDGPAKWVLRWQPPVSGLAPVAASGEAASLFAAELCMEEAIAGFAGTVEAWSRQYAGIRDQSKIAYSGFRQF